MIQPSMRIDAMSCSIPESLPPDPEPTISSPLILTNLVPTARFIPPVEGIDTSKTYPVPALPVCLFLSLQSFTVS